MLLVDRLEERFRIGAALFWAASWGAGAAVGVALGGWLTLVGGSGAPGTAGLEPVVDLVVLPLGTFGVVSALHLVGQVFVAALRGRSVASGQR